MNAVMATSIQRRDQNFKFTTSSRRRYYDIASTLRQLCEERKVWSIHGHMLTILQQCVKNVKIFNDITTFVWYAGPIPISWHQILSYSKIS